MTFVYCDAGLANEQGHFASLCRATTAYLRQRGDHVLVLAHRRIEPGLAAELGATPFFRFHPNASVCDDPLCGPFTDFVQGARITAEDCAQLSGCTPETVVFYEHAKAAQLMGLIDWAQTRFTPEDCPLIVVTFLGSQLEEIRQDRRVGPGQMPFPQGGLPESSGRHRLRLLDPGKRFRNHGESRRPDDGRARSATDRRTWSMNAATSRLRCR